jgi:hypothetical protein
MLYLNVDILDLSPKNVRPKSKYENFDEIVGLLAQIINKLNKLNENKPQFLSAGLLEILDRLYTMFLENKDYIKLKVDDLKITLDLLNDLEKASKKYNYTDEYIKKNLNNIVSNHLPDVFIPFSYPDPEHAKYYIIDKYKIYKKLEKFIEEYFETEKNTVNSEFLKLFKFLRISKFNNLKIDQLESLLQYIKTNEPRLKAKRATISVKDSSQKNNRFTRLLNIPNDPVTSFLFKSKPKKSKTKKST